MPTANLAKTSDALVYLPGIMGSKLQDAQGKIVWGMKPSLLFKEAFFSDVLHRLKYSPGDGIRPAGVLEFPVALPLLTSIEPYRALHKGLAQVALRSEAVLPYAYDWRLSIADAAEKLRPVLQRHYTAWIEQWRRLDKEERLGLPEPRITLVGHSMGGLVASYFASHFDDERLVRRIVTLGTPFAGSLSALGAIAHGRELPFGLFAKRLRSLARTLPGLYELVARWKCINDVNGLRRLTSQDLSDLGGDSELAEAASTTCDKLTKAIAKDGADSIPLRCLVGTTQPTLQSGRILDGVFEGTESINNTDHRGDGTVWRLAASPDRVEPAYLPQSHGALAKTKEGTEFVAAVLTERKLGDYQGSAIGLRVDDAVKAGTKIEVEILQKGDLQITCELQDAETDRLITIATAIAQDDALRVSLPAQKPGLYRILARGGGFSPVERLVSVFEDPST